MVNDAFLKTGGTAEQFRAGIASTVASEWLLLHESGTCVKFAPAKTARTIEQDGATSLNRADSRSCLA
jgi:hypothetical protein